MNKKLQKNIEKRHKEEQKRQQEADKARIKSFKKYKDYVAKAPLNKVQKTILRHNCDTYYY